MGEAVQASSAETRVLYPNGMALPQCRMARSGRHYMTDQGGDLMPGTASPKGAEQARRQQLPLARGLAAVFSETPFFGGGWRILYVLIDCA